VIPGFMLLRGWLPMAYASRAFNILREELPWQPGQVRVFGAIHATPRLLCGFGDHAYTYSGLTHEPSPWHPVVNHIRSAAEGIAPGTFNTGLANYYRDGADTIGWHSDDEPELGAEPVIASLSLGGSRDFCIRDRATKARETISLESGDLLIMSGRSQLDYQHSVPRRANATPRINLTFRKVV
jgi:alkylated DNA repair dioxygenase AlkB